VNGYGAQRIGFFGSDHSPIMLKLKPEWPYLIQNAVGKATISPGGANMLKARKTPTKHAPFRESFSFLQANKTQVLLNYFKLADCLSVVADSSVFPLTEQYFTVHKEGKIELPTADNVSFMSLWDTGASSANYMSSEFYNKHKDTLHPYASDVAASVTLGDRKTTVQLEKKVQLPVSFLSKDGTKHEALCTFISHTRVHWARRHHRHAIPYHRFWFAIPGVRHRSRREIWSFTV
jgi:hypothetical protein